jgi:epoxyqueuosine reductase
MKYNQTATMSLEEELQSEINKHGVDFFSFADISHLSEEQNRGYPVAILLGILLSPGYLQTITITPDFVEEMKCKNQKELDEFDLKEKETDRIADEITSFLSAKGYSAFSQSEKNLYQSGCYDEKNHRTPLPHKSIALLAGLGWIGKHDLLVTPEQGSAISMCTLLTDAPLKTVVRSLVPSRCGNCTICVDSCPTGAITGNSWSFSTSREELVDVYSCTTCLKCLAFCPWTINYMKKNS